MSNGVYEFFYTDPKDVTPRPPAKRRTYRRVIQAHNKPTAWQDAKAICERENWELCGMKVLCKAHPVTRVQPGAPSDERSLPKNQ